MSVICEGCGNVFLVPAGYGRNKIQCPGCGVICPIPAGAAREAIPATRPAPEREASPFDETPIEADIEPIVERPLTSCRRCGKQIRRQRECPDCDLARQSPAPLSMELDSPPSERGDDEDDAPYDLSEPLGPQCRKCKKEMPRGAVLCTACGFDTRTRKKAARRYQPMRREWESDRSLGNRLGWLAAAQVFHVALALMALPVIGTVWPFVITWLPLMVLLCFVLGTYDRIELTRDERGRVKLTKQWRAFFVPMKPVTTDVRGFEGVVSGPWQSIGFLEWFVLVSLLPWGIIPGLVWYYNAMHLPQYMVGLALDHGHAAVYVYRGRNADQMNDIADSLCQAASLRRLG